MILIVAIDAESIELFRWDLEVLMVSCFDIVVGDIATLLRITGAGRCNVCHFATALSECRTGRTGAAKTTEKIPAESGALDIKSAAMQSLGLVVIALG
jgi:hypothetical protein